MAWSSKQSARSLTGDLCQSRSITQLPPPPSILMKEQKCQGGITPGSKMTAHFSAVPAVSDHTEE